MLIWCWFDTDMMLIWCWFWLHLTIQIIKGLKYNQCVDWWSFGVLLYEMVVGQSPFNGCDEDELFWCICNEQAYYPRFLAKETKAILVLVILTPFHTLKTFHSFQLGKSGWLKMTVICVQLLEKDPPKRLGTPGCLAGEICDQPFFKSISWERLERKDIEPPFKPKVVSVCYVPCVNYLIPPYHHSIWTLPSHQP